MTFFIFHLFVACRIAIDWLDTKIRNWCYIQAKRSNYSNRRIHPCLADFRFRISYKLYSLPRFVWFQVALNLKNYENDHYLSNFICTFQLLYLRIETFEFLYIVAQLRTENLRSRLNWMSFHFLQHICKKLSFLYERKFIWIFNLITRSKFVFQNTKTFSKLPLSSTS